MLSVPETPRKVVTPALTSSEKTSSGAAALPAAFTAAARDVDVLVDETRGHDGTTGVDRLEAGDGKALKALLHGDDPAACDEDVATAELFGGEDFGVLDEDGTGHAFSFGPARGQK